MHDGHMTTTNRTKSAALTLTRIEAQMLWEELTIAAGKDLLQGNSVRAKMQRDVADRIRTLFA